MKDQQGYIAITLAIILGIVLLVTVIGLSFLIFFSRQSTTNMVLKETSYFASRACLEEALLKITANPDYTGGEIVNVNGDQCTIVSVQLNGLNRTIRTTSTINRSQTDLKVVVDTNLRTISYEEE